MADVEVFGGSQLVYGCPVAVTTAVREVRWWLAWFEVVVAVIYDGSVFDCHFVATGRLQECVGVESDDFGVYALGVRSSILGKGEGFTGSVFAEYGFSSDASVAAVQNKCAGLYVVATYGVFY